MMKFQGLVNLGVGSLLVVPAVVLGNGHVDGDLQLALDQTVAALDQLTGIRGTLESGDPEGVAGILASSEAPIPAGMERDAHLAGLRTDIGRLAAQLERMEGSPSSQGSKSRTGSTAGTDTTGSGPDSLPAGTDYTGMTPPTASSSAHTGLDDAARKILEQIRPPVESAMGATAPKRQATESLETDGFVVDPVKLGRSYYLAGRWVEGLEILKRIENSPDASYWLGRCLEKLDRPLEAIAAYESVLASETADDYLKDRASNDLDFLRWMQEFRERTEMRTGSKKGATK